MEQGGADYAESHGNPAGGYPQELEIAALAETLPGYKNLVSIKGTGALSAATFPAAIGDIKDFPKPGNLAAYLGTVPRISESNHTQLVGRITKRGDKADRTRLAQCTLITIKYSPCLRDFVEVQARLRRGYHRCCQEASQHDLLHTP